MTLETFEAAAVTVDDLDLVDVDGACRELGGNRPLHRATLYKGIKEGKYPAPIHPGPGMSRWLVNELRACKRSWIAERDQRAA
jgi:hypothetical protein